MSEGRQFSIARRARPFLGIAALLLCTGLVACSALQPPVSTPAAETAEVLPMPPDTTSELAAGTYTVTDLPMPFEVTVPEGWTYHSDGGLLEGPDAFLKFNTAGYVPSDACEWSTPLTEVGPSVMDLADALASAASTTTTPPTQVEVDGYRGVEFDLAVEDEVDIEECASYHVCIHSETAGYCTRYYHEGKDQRETVRIMDLDGDRVIMTVGQWDKDADPAMLESARAVFDSISFDTE
jgi:hypothetical protein